MGASTSRSVRAVRFLFTHCASNGHLICRCSMRMCPPARAPDSTAVSTTVFDPPSEAQLQGDLLVSWQVCCINDPSGGGSNACIGALKVRVIERIEHFPAETQFQLFPDR